MLVLWGIEKNTYRRFINCIANPLYNASDHCLTTHYHADTMLTSSLDVLHILWCRLVCRNSVKLNLVKTGLKSKFGVNP